MTDTDRTFYAAAMAEAESFVAAGYAGPGPRPAVSDADHRRLDEAWADRALYDAAMTEEGPGFAAGAVPSAVDPSHAADVA